VPLETQVARLQSLAHSLKEVFKPSKAPLGRLRLSEGLEDLSSHMVALRHNPVRSVTTAADNCPMQLLLCVVNKK